jgi:xylan 1,4-beta-xylosidase
MRPATNDLVFISVALIVWATGNCGASAGSIQRFGRSAELTISSISGRMVQIVVAPLDENGKPRPAPASTALLEQKSTPVLSSRELADAKDIAAGKLKLRVSGTPLTIVLRNGSDKPVQELRLADADGSLAFNLAAPVLGMGEGAQQFDRRGAQYSMRDGWAGWDRAKLGSWVAVPFLIGTDGWAMFVHHPWGQFDLRGREGRFIPNAEGKDSPLVLYLMAWDEPGDVLKEHARLTGRTPMPPKWTMGYMQSHRTLAGPDEVLGVAKTFREKKLPCDALIYLGTGYCPAGWNTGHGSLEFNPRTFDKPKEMIDQLHALDFRIVLHKNAAPRNLFGISVTDAAANEKFRPHNVGRRGLVDIASYWRRHQQVFALGNDGWWPDDGDELPRESRLARHRAYHDGSLVDRPDVRPWSLHRTGYAGVNRYGGWIWSGDIDSRWATLAAQVSVGQNHSLSLSPYWGTDIGGFFPTKELTGELYARWFQFGAFCSSFRAHGRTWHLRLPWGWNTGKLGPVEGRESPDLSELNNAEVEPICRKYLELRYKLLSYNYTLCREAYDSALPMMRALWLHYPNDPAAVLRGDEYLWGRDLLVAPVTSKEASERKLYLPEGDWYDFWTNEKHAGRRELTRKVDLATLPLYVRAGAILPLDPVRQFTGQQVEEPITVRVYSGRDGEFRLYEDDGRSLDYQIGKFAWTRFAWNDRERRLAIAPDDQTSDFAVATKNLNVELVPGGVKKTVRYDGKPLEVRFDEASAPAAQTATKENRRVAITVRADQPRGELRPIWRFFGADEPNYAYMKDGKKLLAELGELRPKSVYFRTHNLLTSGDGTPALKWGSTGAYREDAQGNTVYDWTILDRIFDTYLERGVRPYAQIGFMPRDLSIKPEPYQHRWKPGAKYDDIYTGWTYPPKDYKKWAELVFQWTKHCVERHGRAEVESWYWQTWNEPNIGYWRGTPQEFYKLHDYAIDAVRRALPTARVGGPDTAGGGRPLRAFLEHCLRGTNHATGQKGTPTDFVAFHAKGAPRLVNGHVQMGIANQLRVIDSSFGIVASFPELKGKPIVIGESDPDGCAACSAQVYPQNGYRNGTLYASYTAASFARKHDLADKHGVNLEGALTWAFEFEDQPYFAGFRSLATNGFDKPVLNVFRMFSHMTGQRLAVESDAAVPLETILRRGVRGEGDVSALASLDKGKLCVLVWHYHDDDVRGAVADVELTLTGLPVKSGEAQLQHFRIDDDHSNAFTAWKRMGSPQQPTSAQYAQLERAGRLTALGEPEKLRLEDSKTVVKLSLPRQSVSLARIEW